MHGCVRSRSRAGVLIALGVALLAALLVGCGSGDDKSSSKTSTGGGAGSTSSSSGGSVADAQAAIEAAQKRNTTPPDSSSRPAAKGKSIAIISLNEANESGSVPDHAAQKAAKAAGWQARIYDAKGNPGTITGLVRQAITTGADGIVVNAIDCAFAMQGFAEAKARGIPIVGMNAFDCDDRYSLGGPGRSLFAADINTGMTTAEFWEQNGRDVANAAIADSGDSAKIITVADEELAGLRWMLKGFTETIEQSQGSKIVAYVKFSTQDFVNGKVVTMVQSALTQHPEATYVKSPFTAATIAAITPAVKTAGAKVKLLGGEGLTSELDLIRSGALVATDSTPGDWLGWAAVDTLNSIFRNEEPAPSGLGWVLVNKDNVPASGSFKATVDFEAAYRKAWGVD